MKKLEGIDKVMIIGSGPIVIGQACEFDYSGTQACKALRSLGYKIVLVNSNPATIMTDPTMADVTYIEPLTLETMTEIIKKERPDALLPNLGGQSALNLASELSKAGVLEKYSVKIIGVQIDAIERGEDRIEFKKAMAKLGIEVPKSEAVYSVPDAERVAEQIGYPVVVRPAYTMGGTGGGIAYNPEELRTIAARGIDASLVNQILIEESVIGWEELELEVVRDAKGQMITVCFIENVDAMGVHTGDSFCVAPMLTISKEVQRRLQKHSYDVVEAIQVIGGTNVQFAHDPKTGRIVIIEINPRTSRSSALASKATGFPIALISAKLAAGLTLDQIPYWKGGTLDKYEPSGDYVVTKFARWAFEKFKNAEDKLGTQMKAVGEVMSIGSNFKEALQKAIRSLENGNYGLGFHKGLNEKSLDELMRMLAHPSSMRYFVIYEALRKGATVEAIHEKTYVKAWFLEQIKELVELEEEIIRHKGKKLPAKLLVQAKSDGFSDKYLAKILGVKEKQIREQRIEAGKVHGWQPVPVSGVDNAAYYYSTYNKPDAAPATSGKKKVMILGGGPNRIGQGIEFDYCCVHAALALREQGIETIMVNCNPETVSTDYDTSDRLYFEPLTIEDILAIYKKEKPDGVIVQFGGQTPLNIAMELAAEGVTILGTSPDVIDLAEDRGRFRNIMDKLGVAMPASEMAGSLDEALAAAQKIGYPLMVRPSFVLGGRGMMVIHDEEALREYANITEFTPEAPILVDKFLENAIECEADAICDGKDAFVPAVMEHIELAGIHSGDSACVIPPTSLSKKHIDLINKWTKKIAQELGVVGLMNIQYAVGNDKLYVLEANPRASRTVPLVSKVCNIQMARIATELMLGKKLKEFNLKAPVFKHYGVKEAVFPFPMFPEVDPLRGPEMRSTGEVLGMGSTYGNALYKAEEGAKQVLPTKGSVLITVCETDQPNVLEVAWRFKALGFNIKSTRGTAQFLASRGIDAEVIGKLHDGTRPNIADAIKNKEIHLVINTPVGKLSQTDDSYIRKAAIQQKIPYITTLDAAMAAAEGIAAIRKGRPELKSLQEYHAEITFS